MREKYIWPTAATDRLCGLALLGLLLATVVIYEATDGAAIRAAQEDKPPAVEVSAPVNFLPLAEAVETVEVDPYDENIPLDRVCQQALQESCEACGVPVSLALGLIEVESGFQVDVVSSEGCYGLMQLNPKYFPGDLDPAGNIQAGVTHLGALLERAGDAQIALTCYNAGHDTGDRTYAHAVLAAARRWEETT